MGKRRQGLQTTEAKNENKRPKYSFKPYQIGGISIDEENKVEYDTSQMKFLSIDSKDQTDKNYLTDKNTKTLKNWSLRTWPNLNMNLNEGYKDFKDDYDETETSFVKLLDWITSRKDSQDGHFKNLFHLQNSSKEGSSDSSKNYFVCTREVLVFIFSSKYKKETKAMNPERYKDFLICATKFQGVIYLRKIPKEENTEEKENIDKAKEEKKNESDDALRKIIYYGHKFEHNITRSQQGPHSKVPNLNKQFYAVMNAQFDDKYYLIFSAQMDAVEKSAQIDAVDGLSYVEIKTNFELDSDNRKNKFRWKLLSWYLQSVIAGVPRLICGYRNNEGIVNTAEKYDVSDLPKIAAHLNTKENTRSPIKCSDIKWSPRECPDFGADCLSFIIQSVVKDNPKTVYTFSLESGENGFACEEGGDPFLPDWYISKMLQHELQCEVSFPYSFL